MPKQPRSGLTLIELMIVVVIIGALASIAVPKFNGIRREAYIATMRSDLHNLVPAEELFFSDSAHYTDNQALLVAKASGETQITLATGAGYWTARATHSKVGDGFSCAVAVNAPNPVDELTPDGQPACRAPRGPKASR